MRLEDYLVSEECTIIDALKKIDDGARGIIFVCRNQELLAAVSDGDIRRSIVKGVSLDERVITIANTSPLYLNESKEDNADAFMEKNMIFAVPIVDKNMIIKNIHFLLKKSVAIKDKIDVQVVIMAGGKGSRLKPYTDILPKPLIPIGNRTIVEHILQRFADFGCQDFNMIVNYKKNFIKSYFSDSEKKWNLIFTEEEDYFGTGGGLYLVKEYVKDTFFMTNCDILIDADYTEILKYHKEKENLVTLVCAKKQVTMPYGTIDVSQEGRALALKEKPSFFFHTNTGLYIMEPEFLNVIPKNKYIDVTDAIQECIGRGERVGVFPIDEENWMDMGQLEEMEKMKDRLGII